MITSEPYIPFFGVVENNDDPEKMGRMQVRAFGYHTRNKGELPTDLLPWLYCIVSNSSGVSGIGTNPYYAKGSTVFGYFLGRDFQYGIVVGSISSAPTELPISSLGFYDPDGLLPKYEPGEPDVNRLARGEIIEEREENLVDGDEPGAPGIPVYPHNKVFETESGHIREWDDTPENERILEWHRTGTYYEIQPDGSRVLKIVGTDYEIVVQDRNVRVMGNVNLTIDGNANTHIKGNWSIKVDGNQDTQVGGNKTTTVGGNITYKASRIDLN